MISPILRPKDTQIGEKFVWKNEMNDKNRLTVSKSLQTYLTNPCIVKTYGKQKECQTQKEQNLLQLHKQKKIQKIQAKRSKQR